VFGNKRITSESIGWKLPFNLAILFHILIISSTIIVPKFLEKKIVIPEFLTVDLVNIAAPLPPPATETAKQEPAKPAKTVEPVVSKPKPKVVKAKMTVPIAPAATEEPAPAPVKAISIKPIKRKIKKKIIPDTSAADARRARKALARKHLAAENQRQLLERQRQQLLQEAQRTKALADAEEAAAKDAVNALKQMYRADSAATSTAKVTRPSNSQAGGGSRNIIESQYQASIFNRLHDHWASPDIKSLNSDLTAIVIIQISKNGQIINHKFKQRSGDRVFDQFVSRAIQESNPLPAIPAAMRVQQYSIGLRFKPGKIQ
jgi:colicin import membrane protein